MLQTDLQRTSRQSLMGLLERTIPAGCGRKRKQMGGWRERGAGGKSFKEEGCYGRMSWDCRAFEAVGGLGKRKRSEE